MTDYYVATGGNDGDPGTEAEPWATVAKVNGETFDPDDQILFNRGDVWAGENLIIPSSGTAGHPITFGAYGTGANPVIDACLEYNDFISDAAAVWKRTPNEWDPEHVFEDEVRLIRAANRGAMVQGSYFYDGNANIVYVWCTDDGNPNTGHVVEHPAVWQGCIDLNGQSYIEIDAIDVMRSLNDGYDFSTTAGSTNVDVSNCVSSWNVGRGVDCGGTYAVLGMSNIELSNITCHDNLGEGFWIGNGSNLNLSNCTVYNSGKDKIQKGYSGDGGGILVGLCAVSCTISDCHVYDIYWGYCAKTEWEAEHDAALDTTYQRCLLEGGSGGEATVYLMGTDTLFKNNIVTAADSPAIQFDAPSDGEKIYHNVIIQDTAEQWLLYCVTGTNVKIKNNILYADVVGEARMIGVWAGCQTGFSSDNNCFCNSGTYLYFWDGGVDPWGGWRDSLVGFQTDSGGDANSMETDPLFVNVGAGDYHIQPTSPAIDTGANVGVTDDYDLKGRPQGSGYDMGAYELFKAAIRGVPMGMQMLIVRPDRRSGV